MKILYAIQGTGNGHLARAIEIVPVLREMADTDVLVSGIQADIHLPFEVQYNLYGVSFIFGKKGGVDLIKTIAKFKFFRFVKDIIKLPVKNYDLVLCDFEPVSAWACKLKGKNCIGISHQNAVLHAAAPKPRNNDRLGKFILKHYAPVSQKFGFHFKQLDNQNFPPVIRPAIRNSKPKNTGHYTVYLPAYGNEAIEKVLSSFPATRWEVFSKHTKQSYQAGNIHFQPVSLENFNHSFINCDGVLCSAGFETPAEALFMGKKLCVIPMKNQYEQECNAAFLAEMGVTVLLGFSESKNQIRSWIESNERIQIEYPDISREIITKIVFGH